MGLEDPCPGNGPPNGLFTEIELCFRKFGTEPLHLIGVRIDHNVNVVGETRLTKEDRALPLNLWVHKPLLEDRSRPKLSRC